MKHILVILAEFYPYPSSNTNCIEPFLNGLLKDGYEVDVVTRKHSVDLQTFENHKGIRIIRIDDYKTMNTIAYNTLLKNNCRQAFKGMNRLFSMISKFLFFMYYRGTHGEERYGGWDIKKVLKVCNELNEKKMYDCIFSISHPIITHKIAQELKKQISNPIKWIIMEFDPFTYNIAQYGKNLKNRRLKQESEFFDQCDKIFLTPELFEYYKKTPLNRYREKFCEINLPNMNEICVDLRKSLLEKNDKRIQCVYGGALLKSIRNPIFMLNFFNCLRGDISITLMSSSRVSFLKEKLNEMKDTVKFYPGQLKEIAHATMLDGDILIDIGNNVVYQTPGKIFEYMSMGKPIIHFSKIEEDPAIKYLINYPMLFIVKEYSCNYEKEIEECKKFIIKYRGKRITFDDVMKSVPELDSLVIVDTFIQNVNSLF